MNDVNAKIAATTSKIIPKVPATIFVKYSTAITRATISLTILSVFPIFFFMVVVLIDY